MRRHVEPGGHSVIGRRDHVNGGAVSMREVSSTRLVGVLDLGHAWTDRTAHGRQRDLRSPILISQIVILIDRALARARAGYERVPCAGLLVSGCCCVGWVSPCRRRRSKRVGRAPQRRTMRWKNRLFGICNTAPGSPSAVVSRSVV